MDSPAQTSTTFGNEEQHDEQSEEEEGEEEIEEQTAPEPGSDPEQQTHQQQICQSSAIDPQIWSSLPSDILEKVLYHLPTISILRSRTISRDWYHLCSSLTFLNNRSLIPPRDLWFAVFPNNSSDSFSAFNPETNRWHNLSLSFLPCNSHGLSSSGGLICCKGVINGGLSIFVCNPISKNWRMLPPLLKKRVVPIVTLIASSCCRSFMVVVSGDDLLPDGRNVSDLSTEVYDSITNRWILSGSLPVLSDLEFGSAFLHGNLYLPNFSPPAALCFNLLDGLWTKVQAEMPVNLTTPSLVECSGRLFLIGGVLKRSIVKSIRVWELCVGDTVWVEFARMKNRVFKEFTRKNDLYFSAFGNGSLICLSVPGNLVMLALNINTRAWIWLPEYPFTSSSDEIHLMGSPFNPSLHTAIDWR